MVLFDEVEKAHPEVLNVLLQLLDDGRLTDAQGRTVDFRNTIVIMTSNLGSQWITEPGLRWEEIRERVMDAVRGPLPAGAAQPHRRDRHLPARSGSSRSRRSSRSSSRGSGRGWPSARSRSSSPTAARELLAREGFDPVYGARPLKRAIQKEIVQPLATRLLRGEFHDGDTIVVDAANGQIVFRRREAAIKAA